MTMVSPITREPIDKPDCGPLQAKSCNYEMRDENKNNYQSKKAPSFGEASEFRNRKRRWENETKEDEKEQKISRSEQQGNHYLEGCSPWVDEKVSSCVLSQFHCRPKKLQLLQQQFNWSVQDVGPKHVFDNKAEDEGPPEKRMKATPRRSHFMKSSVADGCQVAKRRAKISKKSIGFKMKRGSKKTIVKNETKVLSRGDILNLFASEL